jgi:hypothetical protein
MSRPKRKTDVQDDGSDQEDEAELRNLVNGLQPVFGPDIETFLGDRQPVIVSLGYDWEEGVPLPPQGGDTRPVEGRADLRCIAFRGSLGDLACLDIESCARLHVFVASLPAIRDRLPADKPQLIEGRTDLHRNAYRGSLHDLTTPWVPPAHRGFLQVPAAPTVAHLILWAVRARTLALPHEETQEFQKSVVTFLFNYLSPRVDPFPPGGAQVPAGTRLLLIPTFLRTGDVVHATPDLPLCVKLSHLRKDPLLLKEEAQLKEEYERDVNKALVEGEDPPPFPERLEQLHDLLARQGQRPPNLQVRYPLLCAGILALANQRGPLARPGLSKAARSALRRYTVREAFDKVVECTLHLREAPRNARGDLLTGSVEAPLAFAAIDNVVAPLANRDWVRTDPADPAMGFQPFVQKDGDAATSAVLQHMRALQERLTERRMETEFLNVRMDDEERERKRAEIKEKCIVPCLVYARPNLSARWQKGEEQIALSVLLRLLSDELILQGILPFSLIPQGPSSRPLLLPRLTHVIVARTETGLGIFRDAHPLEPLCHRGMREVFHDAPLLLDQLRVPRGTHFVFEICSPDGAPVPGLGHCAVVSSQCMEGDGLAAALFTLIGAIAENTPWRAWPHAMNLPEDSLLLGVASGHCYSGPHVVDWLLQVGTGLAASPAAVASSSAAPARDPRSDPDWCEQLTLNHADPAGVSAWTK